MPPTSVASGNTWGLEEVLLMLACATSTKPGPVNTDLANLTPWERSRSGRGAFVFRLISNELEACSVTMRLSQGGYLSISGLPGLVPVDSCRCLPVLLVLLGICLGPLSFS